ncbi:MAG: 2-C-methyl-D-erythritol 4-phosphate cytidylyltransferase, partial [Mycobacteriales bacterium]
DVLVVIAAAGAGSRFGGEVPKALFELAGRTLLHHAISTAATTRGVVAVVVAAPVDHLEQVRELCAQLLATAESRLLFVAGGSNRTTSVACALRAAHDAELGYSIVLVHDVARALAPVVLFDRVADAVRSGHAAVVPVLPIVDTVRRVDASGGIVETLDRSMLRAIQTPQGFHAEVLHAAHERIAQVSGNRDNTEFAVTDDAGLVEHLGYTPHTVPGEPGAMKITRRHDALFAESLLRNL